MAGKKQQNKQSKTENNTNNGKLNLRQKAFCEEYVKNGGNATHAYAIAYDVKIEVAQKIACTLTKKEHVKKYIEQLRSKDVKRTDIKKDRILRELDNIISAKISDYCDFDGKKLRFKPFSELTDAQLRAIESIKENKDGKIELKLHGKSWSIERINKMLGFDAPLKTTFTDSSGNPIDNFSFNIGLKVGDKK